MCYNRRPKPCLARLATHLPVSESEKGFAPKKILPDGSDIAHSESSPCSLSFQRLFSLATASLQRKGIDRKKFERRRRKDNDAGKKVRENSASFFIDVAAHRW